MPVLFLKEKHTDASYGMFGSLQLNADRNADNTAGHLAFCILFHSMLLSRLVTGQLLLSDVTILYYLLLMTVSHHPVYAQFGVLPQIGHRQDLLSTDFLLISSTDKEFPKRKLC